MLNEYDYKNLDDFDKVILAKYLKDRAIISKSQGQDISIPATKETELWTNDYNGLKLNEVGEAFLDYFYNEGRPMSFGAGDLSYDAIIDMLRDVGAGVDGANPKCKLGYYTSYSIADAQSKGLMTTKDTLTPILCELILVEACYTMATKLKDEKIIELNELRANKLESFINRYGYEMLDGFEKTVLCGYLESVITYSNGREIYATVNKLNKALRPIILNNHYFVVNGEEFCLTSEGEAFLNMCRSSKFNDKQNQIYREVFEVVLKVSEDFAQKDNVDKFMHLYKGGSDTIDPSFFIKYNNGKIEVNEVGKKVMLDKMYSAMDKEFINKHDLEYRAFVEKHKDLGRE